MSKLRVGVFISNSSNPNIGGAFGYNKQLVNTLIQYQFQNIEIKLLSHQNDYQYNGVKTIFIRKYKNPYQSNKIQSLTSFLHLFKLAFISNLIIKKGKKTLKTYKKELYQHIDIIYYTTPIVHFTGFPFIYTLWDLGHLSSYALPELSMNDVFENRKKHHDNIPFKALKIFAESYAGKEDIVNYLNINPDRINVIDLFPSEVIEDNIKPIRPLQLATDTKHFIHYPAQFWSHKNHANLLIAFKKVLKDFPNLKLILSGSDKGNLSYILELIKKLELSNSVQYLGFIQIEELKWIYLNSKSLVMPTLLGPTNMPLLEAAALGCKVTCSNLKGHIEQLGDYATYFNPLDTDDIACKIIENLKDNNAKIYKCSENKLYHSIEEAFNEIVTLRRLWGENDLIF